MKHQTLTTRISSVGIILSLGFAQLALPLSAVRAAGDPSVRGPQGQVGPQNPTGPQAPTGPQTPTGPQPVAQPGSTDTTDPLAMTPADPQAAPSSSPAPADGTADILAPASDSTMANDTTGSNSVNDNTQNSTTTTDVTQNNDADVANGINLNANSGNNAINQNTAGGDIATGDLMGSVNLLNVTNSVFAPGSSVGVQSLTGGSQDLYLLASDGRTLLPTNDTTGVNSSNTNTINGTNVVHLINNNTSDVDNDVTILADTGNNTITENSSLGDIMTGSIDMALNLVNLINLQLPNLLMNLDIWSVFGDLNGNLVLPSNSNTGSNSLNQNTVNSTNDASLDVTQTANVANNFNVATNTGGNTLDQNTAVGDVVTGDVDVKGGVTTIANSGHPVLYLINVLGKWLGEAVLPGVGVIVNELGNSDTGANSENTNTVNQTNTVDADINQTANVDNNVNLNLNTGNNTVARNSKVGTVSTGSINVMANVVNFVNSFGGNLSQFSLGIVNVFGNWFGSAKTAGAQTASAQGSATSAGTVAAQSSPTAAPAGIPASSDAPQQQAAATSAGSSSGNSAGTANVSASAASAAVVQQPVQLASANVLGASTALSDALPRVAGAADHAKNSSSLPWLIAGAVLLAGWVFVELMAARALKAQAK